VTRWSGQWEEVSEKVWGLCRCVGLPTKHAQQVQGQAFTEAGRVDRQWSPGKVEDLWLVPCWLHWLFMRRNVFGDDTDHVLWLGQVAVREAALSAAWRLGGDVALHAVAGELMVLPGG
jgi:hypothetical protein